MKNKAIFLDRDGVINDCSAFVNKPNDLKIYPWVFEALKIFRESGYKIFIVTNQGGIELGYLTEKTLNKIHNKMIKEFKSNGVYIDDIEYCPHYKQKCNCRKPLPGMILKLAEKYDIDLEKSWMIGDSEEDMEAGKAAGCRLCRINSELFPSNGIPINLLDAAKMIKKCRG